MITSVVSTEKRPDLSTVTTACPHCKGESTLIVNTADLKAWREGTLIQNAFPHLDADQRELLQTGICVKCWETIFSGVEVEE